MPHGPVLVVGDGATGRQIARELARTHAVTLAAGRARSTVPPRLLGRSIFWWLSASRALWADRDSWLGRTMRRRDPLPVRGLNPEHLAQAGIARQGRVIGASAAGVEFERSGRLAPATVIWCGGYRDDSAWLRVPGAVGPDGAFLHDHGVAPVPGLYYVGRSWQTCRASALVHGVGRDAERIVSAITAPAGCDADLSPRRAADRRCSYRVAGTAGQRRIASRGSHTHSLSMNVSQSWNSVVAIGTAAGV